MCYIEHCESDTHTDERQQSEKIDGENRAFDSASVRLDSEAVVIIKCIKMMWLNSTEHICAWIQPEDTEKNYFIWH